MKQVCKFCQDFIHIDTFPFFSIVSLISQVHTFQPNQEVNAEDRPCEELLTFAKGDLRKLFEK